MARGYYRNQDDSRSDPDIIALEHLVGRNAAFEVALTLQEYAENIKSAGGGNSGSPGLIADVYIETGGGGQPNCPEISQRLLTKEGYVTCDKIYDKYLTEEVFLLNPITGNCNLITSLKIVDSPIVEIATNRAKLVCSTSHKVIKNFQDLNGTWFGAAAEVLTYTDNCYFDQILETTPKGTGSVMQITLDKEFIYVAEGVLSHNRKID